MNRRHLDVALVTLVLASQLAVSLDVVDGGWGWVGGLAAVGVVAVALRLEIAIGVAAFFVPMAAVGQLGQPVIAGVAGAIAFLALRRACPSPARAGWLARGRLDATAIAMIVGVSVVASVALTAWARWSAVDVSATRAMFPRDHALAIAVALVFAMANAFGEELAFRVVVQGALGRLVGAPAALALQAIVFGAAHLHGFPSGWVGVGLATTYGLMLGAIRLRCEGVLAPWLAHVTADFTIACLILGA